MKMITFENLTVDCIVCRTRSRDSDSSLPLEVTRVTLFKDQVYEDFGFSVSDGLYERGIFVNRIRKGGPADVSGLIKLFDRILQINQTRTTEFDCCLAVPLIAAAGDKTELLITRPFPDCEGGILRDDPDQQQQNRISDSSSSGTLGNPRALGVTSAAASCSGGTTASSVPWSDETDRDSNVS